MSKPPEFVRWAGPWHITRVIDAEPGFIHFAPFSTTRWWCRAYVSTFGVEMKAWGPKL